MTPTAGYPANPLLTDAPRYHHWDDEHTRWSDTDQIGHINNLSVAAYCETGRTMFLEQTPRLGPDGPMFLLGQLIVNFIGELHWPARVRVGTGVLSIGRSSCRLGQGLFDGARCFASSEAVLVMIDPRTRRSVAMPESVRAWLAERQLG